MMTLESLQALAPEGTDVVAFLEALGVPHGGGLVPRHLVRRALGIEHEPSEQGMMAVEVTRRLFKPAAIEIARAERRRGWTIDLVSQQVRLIYNELHEEGPVEWPATVLVPKRPLDAKLYIARKRHLSAAHFLVSGLDRAAGDQLFVFVLVPEERAWLATASALRMLQQSQTAAGATKEALKKKFGRVGVSAAKPGRPDKVWFPVGNTSFDAEHQIRDAGGRQLLPFIARGGHRRA